MQENLATSAVKAQAASTGSRFWPGLKRSASRVASFTNSSCRKRWTTSLRSAPKALHGGCASMQVFCSPGGASFARACKPGSDSQKKGCTPTDFPASLGLHPTSLGLHRRCLRRVCAKGIESLVPNPCWPSLVTISCGRPRTIGAGPISQGNLQKNAVQMNKK
jgi:hypothetical protein